MAIDFKELADPLLQVNKLTLEEQKSYLTELKDIFSTLNAIEPTDPQKNLKILDCVQQINTLTENIYSPISDEDTITITTVTDPTYEYFKLAIQHIKDPEDLTEDNVYSISYFLLQLKDIFSQNETATATSAITPTSLTELWSKLLKIKLNVQKLSDYQNITYADDDKESGEDKLLTELKKLEEENEEFISASFSKRPVRRRSQSLLSNATTNPQASTQPKLITFAIISEIQARLVSRRLLENITVKGPKNKIKHALHQTAKAVTKSANDILDLVENILEHMTDPGNDTKKLRQNGEMLAAVCTNLFKVDEKIETYCQQRPNKAYKLAKIDRRLEKIIKKFQTKQTQLYERSQVIQSQVQLSKSVKEITDELLHNKEPLIKSSADEDNLRKNRRFSALPYQELFETVVTEALSLIYIENLLTADEIKLNHLKQSLNTNLRNSVDIQQLKQSLRKDLLQYNGQIHLLMSGFIGRLNVKTQAQFPNLLNEEFIKNIAELAKSPAFAELSVTQKILMGYQALQSNYNSWELQSETVERFLAQVNLGKITDEKSNFIQILIALVHIYNQLENKCNSLAQQLATIDEDFNNTNLRLALQINAAREKRQLAPAVAPRTLGNTIKNSPTPSRHQSTVYITPQSVEPATQTSDFNQEEWDAAQNVLYNFWNGENGIAKIMANTELLPEERAKQLQKALQRYGNGQHQSAIAAIEKLADKHPYPSNRNIPNILNKNIYLLRRDVFIGNLVPTNVDEFSKIMGRFWLEFTNATLDPAKKIQVIKEYRQQLGKFKHAFNEEKFSTALKSLDGFWHEIGTLKKTDNYTQQFRDKLLNTYSDLKHQENLTYTDLKHQENLATVETYLLLHPDATDEYILTTLETSNKNISNLRIDCELSLFAEPRLTSPHHKSVEATNYGFIYTGESKPPSAETTKTPPIPNGKQEENEVKTEQLTVVPYIAVQTDDLALSDNTEVLNDAVITFITSMTKLAQKINQLEKDSSINTLAENFTHSGIYQSLHDLLQQLISVVPGSKYFNTLAEYTNDLDRNYLFVGFDKSIINIYTYANNKIRNFFTITHIIYSSLNNLNINKDLINNFSETFFQILNQAVEDIIYSPASHVDSANRLSAQRANNYAIDPKINQGYYDKVARKLMAKYDIKVYQYALDSLHNVEDFLLDAIHFDILNEYFQLTGHIRYSLIVTGDEGHLLLSLTEFKSNPKVSKDFYIYNLGGIHWVFTRLTRKNNKIDVQYIDSLAWDALKNNNPVLKTILNVFPKEEFKLTGKQLTVPIQTDGKNCGIFAFAFFLELQSTDINLEDISNDLEYYKTTFLNEYKTLFHGILKNTIQNILNLKTLQEELPFGSELDQQAILASIPPSATVTSDFGISSAKDVSSTSPTAINITATEPKIVSKPTSTTTTETTTNANNINQAEIDSEFLKRLGEKPANTRTDTQQQQPSIPVSSNNKPPQPPEFEPSINEDLQIIALDPTTYLLDSKTNCFHIQNEQIEALGEILAKQFHPSPELIAAKVITGLGLAALGLVVFGKFGGALTAAASGKLADEITNTLSDGSVFPIINYLADSEIITNIADTALEHSYDFIGAFAGYAAADLIPYTSKQRSAKEIADTKVKATQQLITKISSNWYHAATVADYHNLISEHIRLNPKEERLSRYGSILIILKNLCYQNRFDVAAIIMGTAEGCPKHKRMQWDQAKGKYIAENQPIAEIPGNLAAASQFIVMAIDSLNATDVDNYKKAIALLQGLVLNPATTQTYKAQFSSSELSIEQAQIYDTQTTALIIAKTVDAISNKFNKNLNEILSPFYGRPEFNQLSSYLTYAGILLRTDSKTEKDPRIDHVQLVKADILSSSLLGNLSFNDVTDKSKKNAKATEASRHQQQTVLINAYEYNYGQAEADLQQATTELAENNITISNKSYKAAVKAKANNNFIGFMEQAFQSTLSEKAPEVIIDNILVSISSTPVVAPANTPVSTDTFDTIINQAKSINDALLTQRKLPFSMAKTTINKASRLIKSAATTVKQALESAISFFATSKETDPAEQTAPLINKSPIVTEKNDVALLERGILEHHKELLKKPKQLSPLVLQALDEWSYKHTQKYPASLYLYEKYQTEVNSTDAEQKKLARRFIKLYLRYSIGHLLFANKTSNTTQVANALTELYKIAENSTSNDEQTAFKTNTTVIDGFSDRLKNILLQSIRLQTSQKPSFGFQDQLDTLEKQVAFYIKSLAAAKMSTGQKANLLVGINHAYRQAIENLYSNIKITADQPVSNLINNRANIFFSQLEKTFDKPRLFGGDREFLILLRAQISNPSIESINANETTVLLPENSLKTLLDSLSEEAALKYITALARIKNDANLTKINEILKYLSKDSPKKYLYIIKHIFKDRLDELIYLPELTQFIVINLVNSLSLQAENQNKHEDAVKRLASFIRKIINNTYLNITQQHKLLSIILNKARTAGISLARIFKHLPQQSYCKTINIFANTPLADLQAEGRITLAMMLIDPIADVNKIDSYRLDAINQLYNNPLGNISFTDSINIMLTALWEESILATNNEHNKLTASLAKLRGENKDSPESQPSKIRYTKNFGNICLDNFCNNVNNIFRLTYSDSLNDPNAINTLFTVLFRFISAQMKKNSLAYEGEPPVTHYQAITYYFKQSLKEIGADGVPINYRYIFTQLLKAPETQNANTEREFTDRKALIIKILEKINKNPDIRNQVTLDVYTYLYEHHPEQYNLLIRTITDHNLPEVDINISSSEFDSRYAEEYAKIDQDKFNTAEEEERTYYLERLSGKIRFQLLREKAEPLIIEYINQVQKIASLFTKIKLTNDNRNADKKIAMLRLTLAALNKSLLIKLDCDYNFPDNISLQLLSLNKLTNKEEEASIIDAATGFLFTTHRLVPTIRKFSDEGKKSLNGSRVLEAIVAKLNARNLIIRAKRQLNKLNAKIFKNKDALINDDILIKFETLTDLLTQSKALRNINLKDFITQLITDTKQKTLDPNKAAIILIAIRDYVIDNTVKNEMIMQLGQIITELMENKSDELEASTKKIISALIDQINKKIAAITAGFSKLNQEQRQNKLTELGKYLNRHGFFLHHTEVLNQLGCNINTLTVNREAFYKIATIIYALISYGTESSTKNPHEIIQQILEKYTPFERIKIIEYTLEYYKDHLTEDNQETYTHFIFDPLIETVITGNVLNSSDLIRLLLLSKNEVFLRKSLDIICSRCDKNSDVFVNKIINLLYNIGITRDAILPNAAPKRTASGSVNNDVPLTSVQITLLDDLHWKLIQEAIFTLISPKNQCISITSNEFIEILKTLVGAMPVEACYSLMKSLIARFIDENDPNKLDPYGIGSTLLYKLFAEAFKPEQQCGVIMEFYREASEHDKTFIRNVQPILYALYHPQLNANLTDETTLNKTIEALKTNLQDFSVDQTIDKLFTLGLYKQQKPTKEHQEKLVNALDQAKRRFLNPTDEAEILDENDETEASSENDEAEIPRKNSALPALSNFIDNKLASDLVIGQLKNELKTTASKRHSDTAVDLPEMPIFRQLFLDVDGLPTITPKPEHGNYNAQEFTGFKAKLLYFLKAGMEIIIDRDNIKDEIKKETLKIWFVSLCEAITQRLGFNAPTQIDAISDEVKARVKDFMLPIYRELLDSDISEPQKSWLQRIIRDVFPELDSNIYKERIQTLFNPFNSGQLGKGLSAKFSSFRKYISSSAKPGEEEAKRMIENAKSLLNYFEMYFTGDIEKFAEFVNGIFKKPNGEITSITTVLNSLLLYHGSRDISNQQKTTIETLLKHILAKNPKTYDRILTRLEKYGADINTINANVYFNVLLYNSVSPHLARIYLALNRDIHTSVSLEFLSAVAEFEERSKINPAYIDPNSYIIFTILDKLPMQHIIILAKQYEGNDKICYMVSLMVKMEGELHKINEALNPHIPAHKNFGKYKEFPKDKIDETRDAIIGKIKYLHSQLKLCVFLGKFSHLIANRDNINLETAIQEDEDLRSIFNKKETFPDINIENITRLLNYVRKSGSQNQQVKLIRLRNELIRTGKELLPDSQYFCEKQEYPLNTKLDATDTIAADLQQFQELAKLPALPVDQHSILTSKITELHQIHNESFTYAQIIKTLIEIISEQAETLYENFPDTDPFTQLHDSDTILQFLLTIVNENIVLYDNKRNTSIISTTSSIRRIYITLKKEISGITKSKSSHSIATQQKEFEESLLTKETTELAYQFAYTQLYKAIDAGSKEYSRQFKKFEAAIKKLFTDLTSELTNYPTDSKEEYQIIANRIISIIKNNDIDNYEKLINITKVINVFGFSLYVAKGDDEFNSNIITIIDKSLLVNLSLGWQGVSSHLLVKFQNDSLTLHDKLKRANELLEKMLTELKFDKKCTSFREELASQISNKLPLQERFKALLNYALTNGKRIYEANNDNAFSREIDGLMFTLFNIKDFSKQLTEDNEELRKTIQSQFDELQRNYLTQINKNTTELINTIKVYKQEPTYAKSVEAILKTYDSINTVDDIFKKAEKILTILYAEGMKFYSQDKEDAFAQFLAMQTKKYLKINIVEQWQVGLTNPFMETEQNPLFFAQMLSFYNNANNALRKISTNPKVTVNSVHSLITNRAFTEEGKEQILSI